MAGGKNPSHIWVDGELKHWDDATIHISELGWSTVGGVFEGIKAYWNEKEGELYVFRLREHLERLHRSMRLTRLPIHYSVDELTDAVTGLLRACDATGDTYIFPMGFQKDSFNDRWNMLEQSSRLLIHARPVPSHLFSDHVLNAGVSSWRRISEDVMPPRIKNLSNYRNSQLARMDALQGGYDTSILLNQAGKVSEAPGACIVIVRDGKVITPDFTQSVLESITRDAVLKLAQEDLGLVVEERAVDRTELYLADEAFICGTHAEITPVVSVDRFVLGDGHVGPITRQLEKELDNAFRGHDGRRADWRTAVSMPAKVGA
ncbi:MAG TPA: branched-chain amino acid transaminase [Thermomicrobiales bacterium]|nr:branched-chain amino acid transaminase [Thermomicrobiales bacterium]HRA47122.1 branched-chain amino acid transaminase [Thermomicrobiales bacterium]